MPNEKLLTIKEACTVLRIGEAKLSQLSLSKPPQIQSIKIGRRRLYPIKAIDQFIDKLLPAASNG